ncbi:MAG: hypothetical protein LBT45_02860 [Rickettsiales bacterium]|jgi:hypothetical protein|nr:hypothetical protein [Rickettsiales bacterium]
MRKSVGFFIVSAIVVFPSVSFGRNCLDSQYFNVASVPAEIRTAPSLTERRSLAIEFCKDKGYLEWALVNGTPPTVTCCKEWEPESSSPVSVPAVISGADTAVRPAQAMSSTDFLDKYCGLNEATINCDSNPPSVTCRRRGGIDENQMNNDLRKLCEDRAAPSGGNQPTPRSQSAAPALSSRANQNQQRETATADAVEPYRNCIDAQLRGEATHVNDGTVAGKCYCKDNTKIWDGTKCVAQSSASRPAAANTSGANSGSAAVKTQSDADKAYQAEYKKQYEALRKEIRKKFDELEKKALNKNNGSVNDRIGDIISRGQDLVDECNNKMFDIESDFTNNRGYDLGSQKFFSEDVDQLCGNYDGITDGVQKNIQDVVDKLNKEQDSAKKAEQKAIDKAEDKVNSSADKVIRALNDATNAVKANSNSQLKSAATALKSSVANLKKTISGNNSDVMFKELTQNNDLKNAASALIAAMQNAISENKGLQNAASALGTAMQSALNSQNAAELGSALDDAAKALNDAADLLKEEIKWSKSGSTDIETQDEQTFMSSFDELTQIFQQKIAELNSGGKK